MSRAKCKDCGQELILGKNWSQYDAEQGKRYCNKCATTYGRRDPDRGINRELAVGKRSNSRSIPDEIKVSEFRKYIEDPRNMSRRGFPRLSRIFHANGITSPEKGFTASEMAAALFPDECDRKGIPSREAKNAIKNYLKRLTRKYDGHLEIYATPVKRQWRWHITIHMRHTKEQTGAMLTIARGIELNARRRERNQLKPVSERMRKVDILDEYFESGTEE